MSDADGESDQADRDIVAVIPNEELEVEYQLIQNDNAIEVNDEDEEADNENNNVDPFEDGEENDNYNDHVGLIILHDEDREHDNPYYHRIIVDSDDDDGDIDSSDTEAEPQDENTMDVSQEQEPLAPQEEDAAQFDHELPGRHSYLGEGMEQLQGRTIWEDDECMTHEIPILAMNLTLVPGQTLPLTIFHSVFQNAVRRCVAKDRMFGIVQMDTDHFPGQTVSRGALGTLAEIYEFQEESDVENPLDAPISASFALKAKGRSRFRVLSVRRQGDGNLLGRVKILPEVRLGQLMSHVPSSGNIRYIFPQQQVIPEGENSSRSSSVSSATRPNSITSLVRGQRSDEVETLDSNGIEINIIRKNKLKHERKLNRYYAAFTPWPSFVYNQYSEKILVDKLHSKLNELKGLMATVGTSIPTDPADLSFWIAQNLTMEDSIRKTILRMDNAVERLQYELMILQRLCQVVTCANCRLSIANQKDIFAMSIEGPSGNYVNPHGVVHETITVSKIRGALPVGASSTEASWFPGYSWTILQCRQCRKHLGWKFKAEGGRLKPSKFYGLTRKSVRHEFESITEQDDIV